MTYRGRVKNGVVVIEDDADLPEGAEVLVELCDGANGSELHPDIIKFSGILPSDLDGAADHHEGLAEKHQ